MTNNQLKAGDLVVFRSRIDCREVVSAEYDKDGEIKSLYVTDHEKTVLLKFEDRADDPVIELPISFDDVLAEIIDIHKGLQEKYEHRYVNFYVDQRKSFGGFVWNDTLYVEESERDLPERSGYFLDYQMSEDEVKALVKELFDDVINSFTLI